MNGPTVEEGLRAWLRVLPPGASLDMLLLVDDLAPHLRHDPLETVRMMEQEGVAGVEIVRRCPECFGLNGVHADAHEDVAPEEVAAFRARAGALPRWIAARLAPFDIVMSLIGDPLHLQRAIDVDVRIDAPPRPDGATQRVVRLRLGMGGTEAPLVMQPGREYLRLRFGGALDLGGDRRVIDVDAMRLLGSEEDRAAFRERLRRRLHGLHATPLIPPDAGLDPLDESQVLAALEQALVESGRYRRQATQDSWRALAEDWGIPAADGRVRFDRAEGWLLACVCGADVRPHVHAFTLDGQSAEATRFEPSLLAFCEHQRTRIRDLHELRAVRRHLGRGFGSTRGLLTFLGGFGLTKVVGSIVPTLSSLPVDALAVGCGLVAAGIVLRQPLLRFIVLSWRLRSGSWRLPKTGN